MTSVVFAIPGDKDQRTGGYLYNARVMDHLNACGLTVSHLQLPDSFPEPSKDDLSRAQDLLSSIPTGVPVIVDGLALGAMEPAAIASVEAPIIALVHHPLGLETGLPTEMAERLIANESAVLAHVAHVIVTSWSTAKTLIAQFDVPETQITTIMPGFDRPVLQQVLSDPPLILSVGLLTRRKGHDVLLRALAQLTELDWKAEIVGRTHDPEVAQSLFKQALELGLDRRVVFRGEIGEAALQEAYASATVFALATRYEGYGMVLSEAMLHGLPIVSCRVGAVPDTVGDAGCLVAPDDPEAFAAGLRSILADSQVAETYSKHACRLSQNLPTWRDTADLFKDVIEKLSFRPKSSNDPKIVDPSCLP